MIGKIKSNKKIFIGSMVAIVLILGGTLTTLAGHTNRSTTLLPSAPIGEEQVRKLVEIYAGTSNLNYEQIVLKTENNRRYYEVNAYKDNMEYDFDVDAVSGEIFNSEIKSIDTGKTETVQVQQDNRGTVIGEAKVKEIVISKTAKSNVVFTEIKLSQSDAYNGAKIYEVDAQVDNVKYDVDINALTGEVLKYEVENTTVNNVATPTVTVAEQGVKSATQNSASQQSSVQNSSPNNAQKVSNGNSQQATLISQDKVKQIISNKTGKNNLIYTKIQLTRDDDYQNKLVYEVEANSGDTEYEIDIDAINGAILKYEVD